MLGGGGRVGAAWYDLELHDEGFIGQVQSSGQAAQSALSPASDAAAQLGTNLQEAGDKGNTSLGGKLRGAVQGVGGDLKAGALAGLGFAGGMGVAGLAAGGIQGAMNLMGDSVGLASDKVEAASKVNVLFGDSAHIVNDASKTAADTVALSSGKYLALAGDLGNLITNFGITGDAAADMSVDMIGLAADMGSFNNASTEEVTAAMGAAFRGETEPIRRFGVMLSADAVAAKAVELGLAATTKELTPAAKAQATYALILEQTTAAQGDLARTADGLANAQRLAAARQEEAMTKLGDAILPIAQTIMPMLADAGTAIITVIADIAGAIGGWISDNQALIDTIVSLVRDAIDILVGTLGDLWQLLEGPVSTALDAIGALFGIVAAGIGFLIDAVKFASDVFGDLTASMRPAVTGLEEAKVAFSDIATEAGLTAEEVEAAWAEAAAGIADGTVRVDADALRIIEAHGGITQASADMARNMEANWAAGRAAVALMPEAITQMTDESVAASRLLGQQTGEALDAAVAAAVAAGKANVADDTREMIAFAGQAAETQASADALRIGRAVPGDIGKGMLEKSREVLDAADRLIELLKNGLTPAEQAAKLIGEKYTKAVAEGVRSEIPGAKEAAQSMAVAAIKTIADAANGSPDSKSLKAIGSYYDSLLASGMTEAQARTALIAGGVAEDVIDKFAAPPRVTQATQAGTTVSDKYVSGISSFLHDEAADRRIADAAADAAGGFDYNATEDGRHVADTFISGIAAFLHSEAAERRVHDAAGDATDGLRSNSPPRTGPLRFIGVWGQNLGALFVGGMVHSIEHGQNAFASALAGYQAAAALSGVGVASAATFASTSTGTIRIVHELDLRNAPEGITERGVAEILGPTMSAELYLRNLEQAALLPPPIR